MLHLPNVALLTRITFVAARREATTFESGNLTVFIVPPLAVSSQNRTRVLITKHAVRETETVI